MATLPTMSLLSEKQALRFRAGPASLKEAPGQPPPRCRPPPGARLTRRLHCAQRFDRVPSGRRCGPRAPQSRQSPAASHRARFARTSFGSSHAVGVLRFPRPPCLRPLESGSFSGPRHRQARARHRTLDRHEPAPIIPEGTVRAGKPLSQASRYFLPRMMASISQMAMNSQMMASVPPPITISPSPLPCPADRTAHTRSSSERPCGTGSTGQRLP